MLESKNAFSRDFMVVLSEETLKGFQHIFTLSTFAGFLLPLTVR